MQLEFARDLTAESLGETNIKTPLVGSSARMKIVHALIAKLANNNATVLISGESALEKSWRPGRSMNLARVEDNRSCR